MRQGTVVPSLRPHFPFSLRVLSESLLSAAGAAAPSCRSCSLYRLFLHVSFLARLLTHQQIGGRVLSDQAIDLKYSLPVSGQLLDFSLIWSIHRERVLVVR